MNLNFTQKNMEIGTFAFNYVRTLMVAPTGGAEINECLQTASRIKEDNSESWTREWASLAQKVARTGEEALKDSQTVTARGAFLRASNYYRTAMATLPHTDPRLDQYLTLSRDYFHQAAQLSGSQIEVLEIPFGKARLPGYFLSAGQPQRPTLIALNGGDSTNEELVHWIGFAAVERGWNCLVFEGPGQWSALQLNPGLYLRPDYEVPVKAALDYLVQREDVNADRLALIGYSLGTQLAARAAIFERRIKACICSGGVVVDVYEAWHGVWPALLRHAPASVFDTVFGLLEKASPQVRGLTSAFRRMHGVRTPHEMIEAWKPFNIEGLGSQLICPLLLLVGEAEYAQLDPKVALGMLRFVNEMSAPVTMHEFTYQEGWAATHCQVGALAPTQAVVFNWLEHTVNHQDCPPSKPRQFSWDLLNTYVHDSEIDKLEHSLRVNVV